MGNTSAVLLNPPESRCTGVENELKKHGEFGPSCIAVNAHRRNDTQGFTGSSPIRPTILRVTRQIRNWRSCNYWVLVLFADHSLAIGRRLDCDVHVDTTRRDQRRDKYPNARSDSDDPARSQSQTSRGLWSIDRWSARGLGRVSKRIREQVVSGETASPASTTRLGGASRSSTRAAGAPR